jgi:predicted metal-dependent peptidase
VRLGANTKDVAGREWLEELVYYMLEEKHYDYCYALHNIDIVAVDQPFAFCGPNPVPAAVSLNEDTDQITLHLYWPIVSRISFEARMQLVMHETVHVIDGHLSSYGHKIRKMFGPIVANMAMDIYVNQKIDRDALEADGLPGTQLKHFEGFPPDLSSFEYAELLQSEVDSGKIKLPKEPLVIILGAGDPNDPTDPLAGTAGQPGEDFTGKGQYVPSEILNVDEENAMTADEKTRALIQNVKSTLESTNKSWGRGFGGADQAQFVEASKRESEVPWAYYLKALESKHRAEIVIPTRRRPSRRHPAHVGRVRRYGLDVAFVVDTSGSMGDVELREVDPELRALHYRGANIEIYHCDAAVAKVEQYNPFKSLEEFYGRGGTEFSDALIQIDERPQKPGFIAVFTDGYGGIEAYKEKIVSERGSAWWEDFIASNPTAGPSGIETLWILPDGCMEPAEFKARIVPWGQAIKVPSRRSERP